MPESTSAPELFEALDKIAPDLEALAREAEILRRAPDALAVLVKKARLPMAKVPRVVGGYEISPAEQVDYFARIAYLNPTAGWLAFVQNGVGGMVGATLPEAGLAQVFAEDSPLFAGVSAPSGKSRAVDGGFRVSGRWAYGSGVHIADWVLLATVCDEPSGARYVLLPRDQVELHDDWHVTALQGTGSVDISVDDVFVPQELTADPTVQQRGGAQYVKLGYRGYISGEHIGFSLGVAQRLTDEITQLARKKKRLLDSNTIGDRGAFQMELGRTDTTLRATRAYAKSELDRAIKLAERSDEPLDAFNLARMSAAIGWAQESVSQAAMRLFPYAGAGALHLDSPIQRSFRELIGSGQHIVVSNETLDLWGHALLAAGADSE